MIRIFEFGTAPEAVKQGYRMVGVEEETEQSVVADWADKDLIFVKGAYLFGQPGRFEFGRFEQLDNAQNAQKKLA